MVKFILSITNRNVIPLFSLEMSYFGNFLFEKIRRIDYSNNNIMFTKYYIKTFGCAMNFSDSERLASFLESYQFKLVQKIEQADLTIFNTCGIRQMAEDRVYGQIHNLRKNFPKTKIILTGCVAERPDVQKRLKDKVDLFVSIKDFPQKVTEFLNSLSLNKSNQKSNEHYLKIKPKYFNSFQSQIPIMTGCNNFCSYCVVPYARGPEVSRPVEEILSEIKKLIKQNYKEIILLGQNVNSYRGIYREKTINFAQLLQMVNNLPGNFWIRFISSHPKDMSDELIDTITSLKKVCENMHLPIQSGDNTILKKMNRKYTQSHYLKLIEKIKNSFAKNKPGIIYSLTTDIIVGFPGETKERFMKSAEVMRRVKYDMVYFGQFSPRPETAAWNMIDNISKKEKTNREEYLNEILKKTILENNKKYIGNIYEVLIEKEKNNFYFGKTRTAKNVRIGINKLNKKNKSQKSLIGKLVSVKIIKANIWNLEGELYYPEKIIVILGPTASGKSEVAIKLAKKFNGEVISADSRQIYKGMDIGSGKITKTEQKMAPHYMIDIVSPATEYNVAKFKKQALKHIESILSRGKTPIICGGTGFWIKSIVDDIDFPEVKPNWKLREKLTQKTIKELFAKLKKLDPIRAKTIDKKNKVRLIRAIEICQTIGKVPIQKIRLSTNLTKYEFLQIGIKRPKEELLQRIKLNVEKRFKKGMIKEVEKLHNPLVGKGISWKKIQSFGLSYFLIPEYLKGNIKTKKELKEKIYLAEKKYAKRQATWFKKDNRIKWLRNDPKIEKTVNIFLKG